MTTHQPCGLHANSPDCNPHDGCPWRLVGTSDVPPFGPSQVFIAPLDTPPPPRAVCGATREGLGHCTSEPNHADRLHRDQFGNRFHVVTIPKGWHRHD